MFGFLPVHPLAPKAAGMLASRTRMALSDFLEMNIFSVLSLWSRSKEVSLPWGQETVSDTCLPSLLLGTALALVLGLTAGCLLLRAFL